MNRIKQLWKYYIKTMGRKTWLFFALSLFFFCANYALLCITPGIVFDSVLGTQPLTVAIVLILISIGVGLLNTLFGALESKYTLCFRINEIGDIQKRCISLNPLEIENYKGQEKIENAMQSVCSGNEFGIEAYLCSLISIVKQICTVIMYFLLLLETQWWVVGILLLLLMIRFPLEKYLQTIEEKELNENYRNRAKLAHMRRNMLQDNLVRDVKMYNAYGFFSQTLHKLTNPIITYIKKRENRRLKKHIISIILSAVGYTTIIYYFCRNIEDQSIGYFIICIGIFSSMMVMAEELIETITTLNNNRNPVDSYLDMKEQKLASNMLYINNITKKINNITFENVCFNYSDKKIFKNLSFNINADEKIAIVGENGVGKTTLIKILLGIIKPQSGIIKINDTELQYDNLEDYWSIFSVLLQESPLFAFTIKENITCEEISNIDSLKLENVINQTGVNKFIEKLSNSSDTYYSSDYAENGVSFSGGEKQKIVMARALYNDGNILILDEPTAALDAKAESEIYEKYKELTKDKIALFVSHRLSSIKFCDRILFIESNNKYSIGTFDELYKSNKIFSDMYDKQSSYYFEGVS